MIYRKLKAFTLAELMILLLTLSILLAAMAPVFTKRASGAGDEVWSYIAGDDEYDAYYNTTNQNHTAQAFIGITPSNKVDVANASYDGTGTSYAKLVIRASDRLNKTPKYQNQIQLRYGNSAAGDLIASIFAGRGNMLIGGPYNSVVATKGDTSSSSALYNTAYGHGSLAALISGDRNTAIGVDALKSVTSGYDNTAIGLSAGSVVNTGKGNVFVGNNAGKSGSSAVSYNTIIGNNAATKISGDYNSAIGNNTLTNGATGYNVAVGNYALEKTTGSYNTAVGYNAMSKLTGGSYNTALGMNSCLANSSGSYITCIGYNSGSQSYKSITSVQPAGSGSASKDPNSSAFRGTSQNDEVVLIGSMPVHMTDNKSVAVLEVHNNKSTNSNSTPITGAGNETVVVNGNLIVRGNTYLENILYRPINSTNENTKTSTIPKGLVAMKIYTDTSLFNRFYPFGGYDGNDRKGKSYADCHGCKQHLTEDVRENCICTAVGPNGPNETSYPGGNYGSSWSYDWSSPASGLNATSTCEGSTKTYYKDLSYDRTIYLERYNLVGDSKYPGTDKPLAHWPASGTSSCCPNIASDIRLKNVGEVFNAGLEELNKLNIYNYTFKNDVNKLPHVGVIAQDLKQVFPNAVVKGEDGYYKIRWDEMFYAAINSVKSLNIKVKNIIAKVSKDKDRLAELKKSNVELNNKLDQLVDELEKIEDKK